MDNNLKPYIEITDEQIHFKGNTPEEQKLNKWLYNTTLELNRYQDMTKGLLNFCKERLEEEKSISPNEILDLVKEFSC